MEQNQDQTIEIRLQPDINEELFREYLNQTLIPTYGLFDRDQIGTMAEPTDKWLNPAGIMSATIFDFDSDGSTEMLVCYTAYMEGTDSWPIHMAMFEVENKTVVLAVDQIVPPYYDGMDSEELQEWWIDQIALNQNEWTEDRIQVSVATVEDTNYIVWEKFCEASVFANGKTEDYWAVTYENGSFLYAFDFSQTGGGSDDFAYTGYTFENGEMISSALYYQDYNSSGTALYDDLLTAAAAYLEQYGLTMSDSFELYDEHEFKNSILSSDNKLIEVFRFASNPTGRNSGGSAYNYHAQLEADELTE
jgi:hypothetical protein